MNNSSCLEEDETGRGSLLQRLLLLVRRQENWSPRLVGCMLWRVLTNLRTQSKIVRLLSHPVFLEAARANPRLAFKHLAPHYLVRNFTLRQRSACFLHHYGYLRSVLPESLVSAILNSEVTVDTLITSPHCIELKLGLSRECDKEGELSLSFCLDNGVIYVLAFTIIPGWVVESRTARVALITRLQGTPQCHAQIKLAAKSLHETGVNAVLFSALAGILQALNIHKVAAVAGIHQSSYSAAWAHQFKRAYDDFYTELGMTEGSSGLFFARLPIENKPLEGVRHRHRQRNKIQQEFKMQVRLECAQFFGEMLQKDQPVPEFVGRTMRSRDAFAQ